MIKNYSLIKQIQEYCKAKNIELSLTKVKKYSRNSWNNKADKLAKVGLSSNKLLRVKDINTDRLKVLLKQNNKLIDCSIRFFANIIISIIY